MCTEIDMNTTDILAQYCIEALSQLSYAKQLTLYPGAAEFLCPDTGSAELLVPSPLPTLLLWSNPAGDRNLPDLRAVARVSLGPLFHSL